MNMLPTNSPDYAISQQLARQLGFEAVQKIRLPATIKIVSLHGSPRYAIYSDTLVKIYEEDGSAIEPMVMGAIGPGTFYLAWDGQPVITLPPETQFN